LNKAFFTQKILDWHINSNQRLMPWKGETDPYKIWLSEIILQQTRVQQGINYYLKFTENYPTIFNLAKANDTDVFKLWEGLGYYNRCKNLLFTAREIVEKHKGIFPTKYNTILQFKGVGTYTAAAIASFAYNQNYAVIDGNVYRVLSRFFGIYTASDNTKGKQLFASLAQEILPNNKAAIYNQAIMDFGATICKPMSPNCNNCILHLKCFAKNNEAILALPVKEKQVAVKTRWFYYFIIKHKNKVLIKKRTEADIWQNLHNFFLIETPTQQQIDLEKVSVLLNEYIAPKLDFSLLDISKMQEQKLTHRKIKGQFISINIKTKIQIESYNWVDINTLSSISFPVFINSFLKSNFL
jgi:A/G-specific adenine glycosylase